MNNPKVAREDNEMNSSIQLTDEEEQELRAFEEQHRSQRRKDKTMTLRIQGYDMMRRARLPLHFRARIREMKVGDTFIMGSIRHTYDAEDTGGIEYEGVAEVYVKRERRGLYQIYCNWSLLSKPTRPMTFAHATFKWEKGGIFAFVSENAKINLRNICLISRFIQRLIKRASHEDLHHYHQLGFPAFLVGVNVDKNNLTTRSYWSKIQERKVRYKFTDEQRPKPMIECIVDLGMFTGAISF
ncbi:hypothetical protein MKR81_28260 (plasmid) [Vibrio campbellii]|uniref:hypothetical protein n=1 Tax=Vibrio campbellii TaxID=680 RepID=UPI001F07821C|nr:hypothetical protein [Vibrio campbellii]UMM07047.1 hypothetical protein MKR81_28260 [Vibrio campbellii]